jgi:histidinol-phosphate phosphatase family protein
MNLKDFSFTDDWTLFLDRDGVISYRVPDGYVTKWEDFRFLDGVLEALAGLSRIFARIIIVSNQQGVGKGIMTLDELMLIDKMMKKQVKQEGGRIDASYYCTHLASENHPDRKPSTGMGLKAKADFPAIEFSRSVMIGDSASDIEFGKRLGMVTVYISEDKLTEALTEPADFQFHSLLEFNNSILKEK